MNAQALADTVEHMPAGGRGILDRALKLDAVKRCCTLRFVLMLVLVLCLAWSNGPRAQEVFAPSDELQRISARFIQEVTPQLAVSAQVLGDYTVLLEELLANEGVPVTEPQFLLLVDRSARVQAALLLWGAAGRGWHLVGAVPVSTGLPGKFEHFVTPLGVLLIRPKTRTFVPRGPGTSLVSAVTAARECGSMIWDGCRHGAAGAMAPWACCACRCTRPTRCLPPGAWERRSQKDASAFLPPLIHLSI